MNIFLFFHCCQTLTLLLSIFLSFLFGLNVYHFKSLYIFKHNILTECPFLNNDVSNYLTSNMEHIADKYI